MNRPPRQDPLVYGLCLLGMLGALWANSRAQEIALLSWPNAALLGVASLVAGLSYVLTHYLRRRLRGGAGAGAGSASPDRGQ